MSEFIEGQRVKVTIPEFYGYVRYTSDYVDVTPEDQSTWPLADYDLEYIPHEFVEAAPQVSNWPPKVGDVWETPDGVEYFIYETYSNQLVAHPFSNGTVTRKGYYPPNLHEFQALNPELVRRRDK